MGLGTSMYESYEREEEVERVVSHMYIGRSERPRAMQAQSVVCCAAASSSSSAGPSPSSSLSQRTGSVAAGERANIGILWRGTAMTVKKDADAASVASAAPSVLLPRTR